MTAKDKKALKDLVTTYGNFAVIQVMQEEAEVALKDYHDAAVIQRDIVQLRACVEGMKENHLLRQLAQ